MWNVFIFFSIFLAPEKKENARLFTKTLHSQKTFHFHDSLKERYRLMYFEALSNRDLIKLIIKFMSILQKVLLKSIKSESWENHLRSVCRFYSQDINQSSAKTQIAHLIMSPKNSLSKISSRFSRVRIIPKRLYLQKL